MSELEERQLTLFPEDSLASLSVLPGNKEATKMTVISGQKCLELYRKSSPLGCLVRMLLESSLWHSTKCYLTWNIKVTKSKRLLFQLLESAPYTEENEFSFWATPNTMDSLPSRSYEAMKRQATNGGRKNRQRPGNLREQIDPLMCQAYEEARKEANEGFLPTPTARDWKGSRTLERLKEVGRNATNSLPDAIRQEQSGQLNPTWVEWLMGFQKGWTDLNA